MIIKIIKYAGTNGVAFVADFIVLVLLDTYTDINTDEWNCPSCGFLVQVGDHCIYCNTKRIEE